MVQCASHLNNYIQSRLCGAVVRTAAQGSDRRKDHQILASQVRIPMWDMGAGLSDETVFKPARRSGCGT
jgi:hypothetical protein